MDALSALSVAASVIQFVSFTSDVVKMIYDASHVTSGQLPQHARIKQETAKLLELSNGIQQVLQPDALGRPQTVIEETLNSVCADCQAKATALMDALAELEVKPPMLKGEGKQGRRKGKPGQGKTPLHWRHVQQVIKSIWQQRDVEKLQERLGESKEMLMMTIIGSLRYCNILINYCQYLIFFLGNRRQFLIIRSLTLQNHRTKTVSPLPNGST